jgi:NAD(P)H-flavin reductase
MSDEIEVQAPPQAPISAPSSVTKTKKKATDDDDNEFLRYKGWSLDASFFHILLKPILPFVGPIMRNLHSIRWELARPVGARVLPKCTPVVHLPILKSLPFLTLGQLILALPLLGIFLGGYYVTFAAPSVEQSGNFASYALFAVFLTASKSNSIPAFLFGIPYERMIPFHNLSSLTAVVLTFFHIYVAYQEGGNGDDSEDREDTSMFLGSRGDDGYDGFDSSDSNDRRLSEDSQFGLNGPEPNLIKFLFSDNSTNLTGTLLTLSIVLLVSLSVFPFIRRKFFDLWFWTHILMAISAIVFCYLHSVTSITFFAVWWAVDVAMRYLVMASCHYSRKAKLTVVSDDIVEIRFDKDHFDYKPGQFVQFSIPSINPLSFHPISISSAPHEPIVTLHVRALGDWSSKLFKLAQSNPEVPILIEGPYGALAVDLDDDIRYQSVLFVCGGIGITHCQSVAKSVINDCKRGRQATDIRFVWALRDPDMLKVFPPLNDLTSNYLDPESDSETLGTSDGGDVTHDVFLTKALDRDAKKRLESDDPRNLHYGRPVLSEIVSEVKEKTLLKKQKHIAVFVCGPAALVDQTKDVCRLLSSSTLAVDGVRFDVHEEIFEY